MSGTSLALAWAVVTGWLTAWEATVARMAQPTAPRFSGRREVVGLLAGEALLLTLFAALWFRSLGHGGWLLLFALLGLLMELPGRMRSRRFEQPQRAVEIAQREWLAVTLGVIRVTAAGGLLAWLL